MRKIIITGLLSLFIANSLHATTYPETKSKQRTAQKSAKASSINGSGGQLLTGKNGFVMDSRYDDSAYNLKDFDTNNNTITDVLFLYTPEALEDLGHIENIQLFIKSQIEVNNVAFKNNGIPITRRVAGVLPYHHIIDQTPALTELIKSFSESDTRHVYATYQASYYVLITKYRGDGAVGMGGLGGNHVVMSTYMGALGTGYTHVLAHELGHNDGVHHDSSETGYMETYAVGARCGNDLSIVHQSGGSFKHRTPFFSDINIINGDIPCGTAGVAEAAFSYKSATDGGQFYTKTGTFRKRKDAREVLGKVTFDVAEITVSETDTYLTVPYSWFGSPEKYSSIEIYTEHDTASESDVAYTAKRRYFDHGTQEVAINLNNDTLSEFDEVFYIKFRQPNGIAVEGISAIKVTIISDEKAEAGLISFDVSNITVNEGASATINLIRTGGSDTDIEVTIKSSNVTTSDNDFIPIEQVITFKEGEVEKKVTIQTNADQVNEAIESFKLIISSELDVIGTVNNITVNIQNVEHITVTPNKESDSSGGGTFGWLLSLLLINLTILRLRSEI
ncbi:Calx-beta domain-containing protein [Colwellia sp. BRX8-9]|uniref:Calx-beta domain-containing protein n=1 Tax=Colwellia sp. BRX8-9 TaxID=2759831 RepID=UPI0015F372F2|nr:Calx-beta domain-containing protein [Colwellia sp. BRX8-9]MBA6347184.1 hypothetical protein [Colwellia sp. BRX8-9]